MTRETKIGLLVGLGFIVVFAVLLSHTGSAPTAGDGMPLARGPENPEDMAGRRSLQDGGLAMNADGGLGLSGSGRDMESVIADPSGRHGVSSMGPHAQSHYAESGRAQSHPAQAHYAQSDRADDASATSARDRRVAQGSTVSEGSKFVEGSKGARGGQVIRGAKDTESTEIGLVEDLPRVQVRGTVPETWRRAGARSQTQGLARRPESPRQPGGQVRDTMLTGRSAEELVQAEAGDRPTHRVAPPLPIEVPRIQRPTPGARPGEPGVSPSPAKPDQPRRPQPRQKEYLVAKGDTLGTIAKAQYGTASMKVVDFLAASNRDRIKDKDTVIVGQKLIVPALPPELLHLAEGGEALPTPGRNASARASARQVVLRDTDRAEPVRVTKASTERAVRTYEVRPKDTLSSIAARELGSSARWREILKLNQDIDPRRMRPGMKIRIPAKPLSTRSALERVSA